MNPGGKQMLWKRRGVSGFSLIETVIAIAVVAVTFIGIIGLLGLGLANNQTSSQQTVASNIAASIAADLRSTPGFTANPQSSRYKLDLPTTVTTTPTTPLSGITPKMLYFDRDQNQLASNTGAVYAAYVYMTQIVQVGPITSPAMTQTINMVRVTVAWPAQAATPASGSVDLITQFRTN